MKTALQAFQAGDLVRAHGLCRQALGQRPADPQVHLLAGVLARHLGRAPEAERHFRRAVQLAPASAGGHLQLGALLHALGRCGEAESSLETALRLDPGDAAARNELGLVYLTNRRWSDAAACFEQAVALQGNLAIAHYNLGLALQALSQTSRAIACFSRATALAPGLAEAHAKLGNLLHEYGHHAQAVDAFRKAAAARPLSALADVSLAKVHLQDNRLSEAEACLRRAVSRDPNNSDAFRLLGVVLKQAGRFPVATDAFRTAIALNPELVAAYHDLVYARKIAEDDHPILRALENLSSGQTLTENEKALAHFALGKAFDDLGRYEEAIRHFDAANRLESRHHTFDTDQHARYVDAMISAFAAGPATQRSAGDAEAERPLMIVGMMRSGTTLVEQILSSHPEVGAGGELTYWGDVAGAEDPIALCNRLAQAADTWARNYRAELRRVAPSSRYVTDKMPHNFLWLGLIHAVVPEARIIHCRRHPVDTCLSIYFTRFGVAKDFAYDREAIVAFYQQYERLMAHWRNVLPSDRFLEIDYEDVVTNRYDATHRLLSFCGLPWDEACLYPDRNERPVATVSAWQARQPVYRTSLERWRNYRPWLGAFERLIATPQ